MVLFAGGTAELDGSTTLERTRTGTRSRIDCTILFAKDSDRLRPGAGERLRRLATQLQQQGPGPIQVTGYTDDLGSAAHGLDLSRRRAQQVATALSATLPTNTFPVTVRGRGEASPAVPNTSESNRRKNRRVTVILNISKASSTPPPVRPSATTPPRTSPTPARPTATASAPAPQPSEASKPVEPSTAATPASTTQPEDAPLHHWPVLGAIGLVLALVGALVDQIRRRRVISGGPPPDGPPSQPPSSGDTGTAVTATDEQNRGTGAAEAAPPVAPPGSAAISPDTPVPNEQAGASTGSAPSPAAISPAIQPAGCRTSGLDADLKAWFSATTHRPKLTLLGPVHARTYGQALARRKPYYTELLAYLTLKPHGATVDEIADTFSLTTARVRTDMKVLRDWLGHDPTTGQPYLPDARNSPAALQRGIPTYQVQGVLCDYQLFTQLRARAHAVTSESRISDLETALRLVSGEPFTRTRTNGWHWVFEGNRLDLQATTEIVSVTDIAADHHRNEHASHQPASTRADSAKAS